MNHIRKINWNCSPDDIAKQIESHRDNIQSEKGVFLTSVYVHSSRLALLPAKYSVMAVYPSLVLHEDEIEFA